ncbi:hypothetical protein [Streptomyces sp. Root369]|uniref:hypothetical protein n=1 Tax=Streptomyces sp. Root369 TaxID=1736523 RepID=UPI00070A906C|nr:hypothetical protein [Streptomyces sp. Root369]KQW05183.1 hypothetical protein ASD08_42060 [Streptomyces sp. Root369]
MAGRHSVACARVASSDDAAATQLENITSEAEVHAPEGAMVVLSGEAEDGSTRARTPVVR